MHKGAAALLWGEPAASMLASVFCWRAACFRRGGNHPRPGLPPGGNGKGGLNSLLPQANLSRLNISFLFPVKTLVGIRRDRPATLRCPSRETGPSIGFGQAPV